MDFLQVSLGNGGKEVFGIEASTLAKNLGLRNRDEGHVGCFP